jgi:heterodisulfide reductase subunit A
VKGSVLVVGGGIAGMQSALDLADSGYYVYLLEKSPAIGGVMAQLDKTFPTNDCAMCTQAPRLVEIGRHKDIEIITLADIQRIEGQPGNFSVTLKKRPRFVNEDKCTGCGTCVSNCPTRNAVQIAEKIKVELGAEDLERLTKIIAEYKEKENRLLPILQKINLDYNYLPENALRYISQELDIPLSLIYRLATFYNAFSLKPRGEHVIRVCLGTACYVRGGQKILNAFENQLGIKVGGITKDMKFSLDTVSCIGCCGQSPGVVVDEDVYGYVKQKSVPEILERYK